MPLFSSNRANFETHTMPTFGRVWYNAGMPTEIQLSTIAFQSGHATLQVFEGTNHLVAAGINAQWHYDNNQRQDFHIWNTAFGHEDNAPQTYAGNPHRAALSNWLMVVHGVAPNTLVLLHLPDFCGFD